MHAREDTAQELWVCDLGEVRYGDALALQERLRTRRQAGELPDVLLALEHPPTYTLGRRAGAEELPMSEDFYASKGIELHTCDRGGRVTYHGPGQLVCYPIVAITDVLEYVRALERVIVAALARVGVDAHARPQDGADYTGVWCGERKIASIGVHVQRGVTTHGFAVNVSNDLEPFEWIVACGLPGVSMTSLERVLGGEERDSDAGLAAGEGLIDGFRAFVVDAFCEVFAKRPVTVTRAALDAPLSAPAVAA